MSLRSVLCASSLSVLWLAGAPAGAQVESKCLSSQLKAGAASAAAQVKCEARAAARGEAVDPACLAKATEKAGKALGKAEAKDDCVVAGSEAAVAAVVDEFVEDLVDALNPPEVFCCQAAGACLYAADAAACTAFMGTLGAKGSVCNSSGSCTAPPAVPGACCEDFFVTGAGAAECAHGASLDAPVCAMFGGTFSASAICTPAGSCQ